MARNHLGINVKLSNLNQEGVFDFYGDSLYDSKTKNRLSWNYLLSRIPADNLNDFYKNKELCMSVGVAQRAVEIPKMRARRLMRFDLKNSEKLPPRELLFENPDIYDMFKDKIDRILEMVNTGEISEEDAFYNKDRYDFTGIVITGVSQDGRRDYEVALKAVEEFEKMKETDPDTYEWINEFWRVYREIAYHWVEYGVDSHLISRESADIIHSDNLYYVGFQRILEWESKDVIEGKAEMRDLYGGRPGGYLAPTRQTWAVMGSDKPIGDPVANLIRSWNRMVESGDANFIVNVFANAFQPARQAHQGDVVNFGEMVYVSKTPERNSITFWRDGKKMWLVFSDEDLFKVWNELMPSQKNKSKILAKAFQIPARVVRKSIILSGPFIVRNIIRDLRHLIVIGQGLDYLFKDIGIHEPWNKLLEKYGGGQFGFVLRDRTAYNKMVENMIFEVVDDPKKYIMNPLKSAKKAQRKLFDLLESSERPARIIQFIAAYKEGILKYKLSPEEAAFRAAYYARDLLDFAAAGLIVREINKYAPFTSAAIRGLEKDIRTARTNPLKVLLLLLFGPAMSGIINSALIKWFGSEMTIDEYKSMPQYRRDMFNIIPLGDTGRWLLIPKPFEIGAVASIFQRIFDYYALDDKNAFSNGYLRNVWHLFMPYDIPGLTGGFGGFAAIFTNRDYFRQKYIIPPSEREQPVVYRNTESASKFGQAVQDASTWFTKGPNPKVDARMVDAFIEKQLPYYGRYFLKIIESATPGESSGKYKFNWTDTGLIIDAPAFNSPDAQYVFRTMKKYKVPMQRKAPDLYRVLSQTLNLMYRQYYDEKTQTNTKLKRLKAADIRGFMETAKEAIEPIDWEKVSSQDAKIKKALMKIRGY